jgi:hypothetical protein
MDLWTPPFSGKYIDEVTAERQLFYRTKDSCWLWRMKELAPRLTKDVGLAMNWMQFQLNQDDADKALRKAAVSVMRQWREEGKVPASCKQLKNFMNDHWYPHYTQLNNSYHVRKYCCLACRRIGDMEHSCLNPSDDNVRIFEHGAVIMCEYCYNYGLRLNYNHVTMKFSVPKTYDEQMAASKLV